MIYTGSCHCGRLKASFESQKTPQSLGVRTCQCEFCRRVGAVNISDPDGAVVIEGAERDMRRYRFALKTADFLICRECGVYIAAVTGEKDNIRSTLNVAGLRIKDFLGVEEAPMQYGAEDAASRVARRAAKWTPTRFTDAGLNASYFGPH
ncbi:MAG: aldehyde-activating protein [Pseudomonadota bacterium]|nr:aldehyde-activating protein [Pseudomonadota bacterium]